MRAMPVAPIKFRSLFHPLRRSGSVSIDKVDRWPNYQTLAGKWSGFPCGLVGQIVAVAVYPNNSRQQVVVYVGGSSRGDFNVMFPINDDKLLVVRFDIYNAKGRRLSKGEPKSFS